MPGYEHLASCYDSFTADVNYPRWADYIERHFARRRGGVHTVLDLACGTGSMSWLLAERGYELIGVDAAPEMLALAQDKQLAVQIPPIFLCQRMERLDLYGTVDACICMLDSVNHITKPKQLQRALARMLLFLEPGGLLLFDILTPSRLAALDGGMFLDESDEAYCVWRTDYFPHRRALRYAMDVFTREDSGLWSRGEDVFEEYAYEPEELVSYLEEAGFCRIKQHAALSLRPPKEGEERIFFSAYKKG